MSFAMIAIAATGIGTYISYQGQQRAADAAEQTAKYNARVQRAQAMQEMEVAKENSRRKARENARVMGQQRAAIAASGLAMEGTPLAVLGETAMTLQRDILDIGYEAKQRARTLQQSAAMGIWEGKQQASAIRTQALTTGLEGIGRMAGGFLEAKGMKDSNPYRSTF